MNRINKYQLSGVTCSYNHCAVDEETYGLTGENESLLTEIRFTRVDNAHMEVKRQQAGWKAASLDIQPAHCLQQRDAKLEKQLILWQINEDISFVFSLCDTKVSPFVPKTQCLSHDAQVKQNYPIWHPPSIPLSHEWYTHKVAEVKISYSPVDCSWSRFALKVRREKRDSVFWNVAL